MSSAAFIWSEWHVFLDGIEVPHQGLEVSFPTDDLSRVMVQLEPDSRIANLRPNTLVHIFARDRFSVDNLSEEAEAKELGAKDKRELLLFWEGQCDGIAYSKSATTRVMTLRAVSLLGILDSTKALMMGLGGLNYSPLITGSTLIPPGVLDQAGLPIGGDLLTMRTLSEKFAQTNYADEDVENFIEQARAHSRKVPATLAHQAPFRESTSPSFGERLIRLIVHLSTYNGVLRQMVIRTRLLAKLAALPDSSLESLISLKLAPGLLGSSQNQISANASVLDVVRNIAGYAFYHFVQMPMPPRATRQPPVGKTFASFTSKDAADSGDQFRIEAEFYRNDIVFIPETYYTLPPPCNLIFPDMVTSFSIDRYFNVEPTRLAVMDPFLATQEQIYHFWLAPTSILRNVPDEELANLTSAEVFAMTTGYARSTKLTAEEAENSAYSYAGGGDPESKIVKSLLGVVIDLEFEKGIITSIANQGFEQFAARAFFRDEPIFSDGNSDYSNYMLELATYRLQLLRFQRQASVSLVGHRWIAPGFPIIIFDQHTSYLAQVRASTLRVDPEGRESTDLVLAYARPVPTIDMADLRAQLASVKEAIDDAAKLPEINIPSFDSASSLVIDALSDFSGWLTAASTGAISDLPAIAAANPTVTSIIDALPSGLGPITIDSLLLVYFGDEQINRMLGIQFEVNRIIDTGKELVKAMADAGRIGSSGGGVSRATVLAGTAPAPDVGGITHAYLQFLFSDNRFVDLGDVRVAGAVGLLGAGFNSTGLLGDYLGVISGGDLVAVDSEAPANSLEGAVEILGSTFDFINLAQAAINIFLTSQATTLSERDFDNYITPNSFTGSEQVVNDLVRTKQRANDTVNAFETKYDWPSAPTFFNPDLLDPASLDEIYQELLGCQPLYGTSLGAESLSDLALIQEFTDKATESGRIEADDKLLSYLNQLQGYILLDSIFPILDPAANADPVSSRSSARLTWKQVSENTGTGAGPFQWAHHSFLKRRATTLGDFLSDNNLELIQQHSDLPTVTPFWQMAPPTGSSTTIGTKVWDDSIFSKIVDDRAIRGLTPDNFVAEARASADSNFLTTLERQTELLKYATEHFGGRGFTGS
jgi:hypothetical protein